MLQCRCVRIAPFLVPMLALSAHATDGNELIGIGAVQKGTAGAGVAAPQDATWALLNPAAIVDLDKRLDISVEYLDLFRGSEPDGFGLVVNPRAFHLTDHGAIFVPSFGMIWPLEHGTLGFGLFGVQGNNADYDRPRTTLGLSRGNDRRSSLSVAKLPLSYAYKFDNGWAVGASLLGAITEFRTDSLTLRLRPAEGNYEKDYAFGIGLQLSLYKEWERFRFGATWTSRQAVQQYEHHEDVIKWNLDLPEKIQIGVAWKATPKLELLADYKWQDWSEINQFAKKTIEGGLGWVDQDIYKLGAIYRPNERWALRAGFSHGNAPVTEEFVFANALSPAIAEDHITFGFSHRINAHHEVHFAYTHTLAVDMTDNGHGDLFSIIGRGTKVEYEEEAYTVQYTYRF
ncbi:MAG: outer membrane protein transport protein [Candidatus Hydrogenedentes bacterium]|nr:outer membrane protein transport protein [Candidatus Hydrogenedentota bacterium]